MAFILTADQTVALSLSFKDREGNAAEVDGLPQWASSDGSVAAVEVSEDGLSAVVVSKLAGQAQVSVTADARLGDEVVPVFGTFDVQVVPGEAAIIEIAAGTPTAKE